MKKSWLIFHNWSFLLRSFWCFVLLVLEYCSVVWCSVVDSNLKLWDSFQELLSGATFPIDDL